MLEREAATNRRLYQTFLSRFKETNASKYSQSSHARLVDAAVPALLPIRPAKARTVAIAAALSLLLGVIGSLLLKALNNTVKTSGDVEAKLHQPFLAALPVLLGNGKQNIARAVLDHPHGLFAESIRTASTGVLLSALDTTRPIVVVTSSVREEGKSTFAMNLAFSQAKTKRVLLIEGDMRRPCFAKVMNLSGEQKGLSQLLSGACTFEECLLQVDGTFVICRRTYSPQATRTFSVPRVPRFAGHAARSVRHDHYRQPAGAVGLRCAGDRQSIHRPDLRRDGQQNTGSVGEGRAQAHRIREHPDLRCGTERAGL